MIKRISKTAGLTGVAVLVSATAALAHTGSTYVEDGAYDNAKATHGHDTHQHGGTEGHVHVDNYGLEEVSKLELSRVVDGKVADVGVFKEHAYLAAWGGQTCKHNGVHVVDIADVQNPREIAFIPSKEGSYPGEGVQALSISTAAFSGDVLVTNNEKCKQPAGFGGMNVYDVSDPANPQVLTQGFGDDQSRNRKQSAHQTHSVFAWQHGDKAYAVMVDNEEAADVDVVDISDPRKPRLVAEYDLAAPPGAGGVLGGPIDVEPNLPEVFLHDMVVKEVDGKQVMLASYWDGGYVALDVTDPRSARLLADSDFGTVDPQGQEGTSPADGVQGTPLTKPDGTPVPPEGNAHQAEWTRDSAFVLAADEDFSPFASPATNVDDGTALVVGSGSGTKQLAAGGVLEWPTVFAGRGCNGDALPSRAPDAETFAVVERGLCTFTEKVTNMGALGYAGVIIFNRTGSDACNAALGMSVEGKDTYAFGVAPREQGLALFDQEARYDDAACKADAASQAIGASAIDIPLGTGGDRVKVESYFDGWGYVRLLDGRTLEELDTYAVPEAHDPAKAEGFGDLSVHEIATSLVDDRVAFLSYYAAGARVVEVQDGKIREIGAYIDTEGGHDAGGEAHGGNNFWGVEAFLGRDGQEYVALSDRDFGLYILKRTTP